MRSLRRLRVSQMSPVEKGRLLKILGVLALLVAVNLLGIWWIDLIVPSWRAGWRFFFLLVLANLALLGVALAVLTAWIRRPVTGREGMLGQEGIAISPIAVEGQAKIRGEIWRVSSDEEIQPEQVVVVVEVQGIYLKVKSKE